jgi:hypothetical protein
MAVALVRWWVAHDRVVFHLSPDEPGQLAMARFLGGGTTWHMFDHSTRSPGFAIVLAPLHWITADPPTVFRTALVVNAVLGGVAVAILCVLARRLTDLSPTGCVLVALAASLLPGALFVTEWVWAESLVPVVVFGTLLALLRLVDRPSIARGAIAAGAAATAHLTHNRLLPLVITTLVVTWTLVVARRWDTRSAAAVTALTVALGVAVVRFDAFVVGRVWDDAASINSNEAVLAQVTKFSDLPIAAAGQIWYLLVTTLGLVGIGAAHLLRTAARRRAPQGAPDRTTAWVTLGVIAPLVALSIVFMADRTRPDQIVYGRYNDAVVGPLIVVGIATIISVPRRAVLVRDMAAVIITMAGTATALAVLRGDELAEPVLRPMVLGLQFVVGDDGAVPVLRATLIAALVLGALVAARWMPSSWGTAAVGGILSVAILVAGGRTDRAVGDALNSWESASAVADLVPATLPPGETVRFRQVTPNDDPAASWSTQRHRRMLYQFYLPDNPMVMDGNPVTDRLSSFVFAPVDDPVMLGRGAAVVWLDPGAPIALYRTPR